MHETPDSELLVVPEGLGVDWTIQLVPFQTSARRVALASEVPEYPTAIHAVDEVHETPFRTPFVVEVVPPVPTTTLPSSSTATQSEMDGHERPEK
jgi:1-acyl-sn-glycerol-3-phosphate acyltransferase